MNIAGKTVIVTGGGSGIGEDVARGFAEAGANVVIFDRDEKAAQIVAEETGGSAFACDVADSESAAEAFAAAKAKHGNCHVLVHCA